VSIKTQLKDRAAIVAACGRLGLESPEQRTVKMYEGSVTGLAVKLKGWLYPFVVDTKTGEIKADNYGGKWGADADLDAFKQAYAVEKAKIEARKKGHQVVEKWHADGSIQLTITTGR
jgi:hypothetical protein